MAATLDLSNLVGGVHGEPPAAGAPAPGVPEIAAEAVEKDVVAKDVPPVAAAGRRTPLLRFACEVTGGAPCNSATHRHSRLRSSTHQLLSQGAQRGVGHARVAQRIQLIGKGVHGQAKLRNDILACAGLA